MGAGSLPASELSVTSLPVSPVADTEASTNVAFNVVRSDVKDFDVRIELAGSISNNVQIAFGRDTDGDGELSLEETGLTLGWRGGNYCIENVSESMRILEAPASTNGAARVLHMHVVTDLELVPKTVSFENESGPCFAAVAAASPDWLYRTDWNLLRVTRRGADAAQEWCRIECDYRRFVIRIR